MLTVRWLVILLALRSAAVAFAQAPPIADRVDKALLPSGISELPIDLFGELVTVFKADDGTAAQHFTGDFRLQFGIGEEIPSEVSGAELRAAEAVIWIVNRTHQGRAYRHLQIFLWRGAEVMESGGTRTSGPLLFVTLNTFGQVRIHADDVARSPYADPTSTEIYQQGDSVRQAIDALPDILPDARTSLLVFDPTVSGRSGEPPGPRPVLYFRSPGRLTLERVGPRQVLVITGGVYLARGTPEGEQFLEIQADNAVVFFAPDQLPADAALPDPAAPNDADNPFAMPPDRSATGDPNRQLMETSFGNVEVEGAYLEGDIRMAQGPHAIRSSRLYYNFADERAVILDAVAGTIIESRGVPIYLRADEIRQLSANRFVAQKATLTTSEFHTPHYHVGAERVELTTESSRLADFAEGTVRGGTFDIRHATLNLHGRPVAYWPHIRGELATSETSLRSLRTGYSGDFGVEFETKWHLFNLMGYETPEGYDATLSLGFYTDRGPFAGVDVDYTRDRYFGRIRSFAIADYGEDELGREREDPSGGDLRGRYLMRHRHYLEDDWQISLELSYISDRSFLEEFFEKEFDTGKEQETLVYLKKQRDNWAFTALLQYRILDFLTQTERLPDLGLFLIGESLGDAATWFSENRLGFVRYRVGDQTFRDFLRDGRQEDSDSTLRADTRQEIQSPLDLGPWRFVPFAVGRGTFWSDSPDDGSLARGFGMVGVRGSMYLSRVFEDTSSTLLDINGLRHIIKPQIVAWAGEANHSADDLFPFDPTVEGIDASDGVMLGFRQRFQTKRGPEDNRRLVDVFTHDLHVAFFNDADTDARTNGYASFTRPEDSVAVNHLRSSLVYRINDRTALLSELNYALNDGELDIANVSLAVERTPRFSYLIGYRFIDDTKSNLIGLDLNYRMTEKHTLAFRELFDLERGRSLDFTIGLIRRFPRWFGALILEIDEAEDDYGVSFSFWPEGLPPTALGSRRFTGLATTSQVDLE